MKVVYADGEYTLFYACYVNSTTDSCLTQAMEVTLVGKSREISTEKRDEIYATLPNNCFDPEQMIETKFLGKKLVALLHV